MRVMSRKDSELFDKLVTLANGDLTLVQRAISASVGESGAASLSDIIRYIEEHRVTKDEGVPA